jgi:hypothetical protein
VRAIIGAAALPSGGFSFGHSPTKLGLKFCPRLPITDPWGTTYPPPKRRHEDAGSSVCQDVHRTAGVFNC